MRAFVAVHPGGHFQRELDARLDGIRPLLKIKWTRPESWHLTMQFLGNWPLEKLNALQAALPAVDAMPTFEVQPGNLDGFPSVHRPRCRLA